MTFIVKYYILSQIFYKKIRWTLHLKEDAITHESHGEQVTILFIFDVSVVGIHSWKMSSIPNSWPPLSPSLSRKGNLWHQADFSIIHAWKSPHLVLDRHRGALYLHLFPFICISIIHIKFTYSYISNLAV